MLTLVAVYRLWSNIISICYCTPHTTHSSFLQPTSLRIIFKHLTVSQWWLCRYCIYSDYIDLVTDHFPSVFCKLCCHVQWPIPIPSYYFTFWYLQYMQWWCTAQGRLHILGREMNSPCVSHVTCSTDMDFSHDSAVLNTGFYQLRLPTVLSHWLLYIIVM